MWYRARGEPVEQNIVVSLNFPFATCSILTRFFTYVITVTASDFECFSFYSCTPPSTGMLRGSQLRQSIWAIKG
jgi:hypothetical protein